MYRMYIDETGNADLEASADPVHRFLSLTGVIVDLEQINKVAIPEIQKIKAEILELDPDKNTPLHRKELMNKKYPFLALNDPAKELAFNTAILKLLTDLEYNVVTVVIDKQAHLDRYHKWAVDPYHYCLRILFERYCYILKDKKARGDLMSEARGKREDQRLALAYTQLHAHPTPVHRDVVDSCLTSKRLKIERKERNVVGLQIADLIAHPSAMLARTWFNNEPKPSGFGWEIVQTLRRGKKYHRHWGRIKGAGLKWLP
jgi:hypothetical protein